MWLKRACVSDIGITECVTRSKLHVCAKRSSAFSNPDKVEQIAPSFEEEEGVLDQNLIRRLKFWVFLRKHHNPGNPDTRPSIPPKVDYNLFFLLGWCYFRMYISGFRIPWDW